MRSVEFVLELLLFRSVFAPGGDCGIVARRHETEHALNKVSESVGEIMIDVGSETRECEIGVAAFRCVRRQPPSPTIRGQKIQCLIEEDATAGAGRELPALISQPIHTFDDVDGLPGLAGSQQSAGKAHCVKRDVVLGQELNVSHIAAGQPPRTPIAIFRISLGPFLRGCNVFDWCVEPDIENFAFEARLRDRDAPCEVARDASIANAFIQPFPCN